MTELDKVEGVQSVSKFEIINLYDLTKGYVGNLYDIETATKNNIVYPSLDPSIFEIRFPNVPLLEEVLECSKSNTPSKILLYNNCDDIIQIR